MTTYKEAREAIDIYARNNGLIVSDMVAWNVGHQIEAGVCDTFDPDDGWLFVSREYSDDFEVTEYREIGGETVECGSFDFSGSIYDLIGDFDANRSEDCSYYMAECLLGSIIVTDNDCALVAG